MANWKEYILGDVCKKIGSGATPGKTILSDHNLPENRDHLILLMIKKLRRSI